MHLQSRVKYPMHTCAGLDAQTILLESYWFRAVPSGCTVSHECTSFLPTEAGSLTSTDIRETGCAHLPKLLVLKRQGTDSDKSPFLSGAQQGIPAPTALHHVYFYCTLLYSRLQFC